MSQYRSANLININKVQVTVKRPAVKIPKPIQVAPVKHIAPVPRKAVAAAPPQITPPPRPIKHAASNIIVRQMPPRGQVVAPNRQHLSAAENQRRAATRPKETSIEAYKDNILRLKGIGLGRILVILACGPSVNEVPIEKLKDNPKIDIMCINKPNPRVWPAKYWAFCDQTQYSHNLNYWEGYTGTIINAASVRARHRSQILIRNIAGAGFSKDLMKGFYIGRSTTYANMQTALWMDYPKVFIFGCDMAAVNGSLHYYGKNPDVADNNRIQRFNQEAESYSFAAKTLHADERSRFFFCSNYNKFDFVNSFQRLDHTTAVDTILDLAKQI